MDPQNPTTVEPLHKVTLTLTPATGANHNSALATVDLIVGLGVAGLTPLEQRLIGRSVGDTFKVDLSSSCWEATMGSIPSPFKTDGANETLQSVTVTVTATQSAKPEEVVKEMAYLSGGCSGCDCGCDGH